MILKDYDQILFNLLKPLKKDGVQLYLNTVPEDEDSQPLNFVLYRSNVTNSPLIYGDGLCQIRECECDVLVNEYGVGNASSSGELARKVEQLLVDNELVYRKYFPPVELKSDTAQTTFVVTLR